MAGLGDVPRSGLTYSEETLIAPRLLPVVISRLGRPAREIAADHQLRGALCDSAQVSATRLLLILTGHFSLCISAILRLGNGSGYQQDILDELDTARAVGLLCLTELGGTNGADHVTEAHWDPDTDGYWITGDGTASQYFMPNAASVVPKVAVVTARLMIDGEDEGVLPFLVRLRGKPRLGRRVLVRLLHIVAPRSRALQNLRTSAGMAKGVDVAALPDKSSAPMDHGIYRFDRVWVPRDALLGGDWARMDPDGSFVCDVPKRQRFHRAISVLSDGRLDLANAAIASARAALAGMANYAWQRKPGRVVMADRDNVQLDQVSGLAAAYATSVLGRRIRDMRATTSADDRSVAVWSMLAKPLLSNTALRIVISCQQRVGAQGALRSNLFPDWIGNIQAIITAEGENRILQIKAGTPAIEELRLPGTPEQLPWYIEMLMDRESRIAESIRHGDFDRASAALGPESMAVEMAEATSQRLAATALFLESVASSDPAAARLTESAAAAYALGCIHAAAVWFVDHPRLPQVAVALREHRGVLIDNLEIMLDAFELPDLSHAPVFSENYLEKYEDWTGWAGSFPAT